MPMACKICIMSKGLKGSDLSMLPKNEKEMEEHLLKVHGIFIQTNPKKESNDRN